MMWVWRFMGPSLGQPPLLDSKNDTNVNSSGLDVFRLSKEGRRYSCKGRTNGRPRTRRIRCAGAIGIPRDYLLF